MSETMTSVARSVWNSPKFLPTKAYNDCEKTSKLLAAIVWIAALAFELPYLIGVLGSKGIAGLYLVCRGEDFINPAKVKATLIGQNNLVSGDDAGLGFGPDFPADISESDSSEDTSKSNPLELANARARAKRKGQRANTPVKNDQTGFLRGMLAIRNAALKGEISKEDREESAKASKEMQARSRATEMESPVETSVTEEAPKKIVKARKTKKKPLSAVAAALKKGPWGGKTRAYMGQFTEIERSGESQRLLEKAKKAKKPIETDFRARLRKRPKKIRKKEALKQIDFRGLLKKKRPNTGNP